MRDRILVGPAHLFAGSGVGELHPPRLRMQSRQPFSRPRMVCQFSCGAASAVATKLTIAEHSPDEVIIVNAFIQEEHQDNRRFLSDCERWFGRTITVLRDVKYGASTDQVWITKRFMKGLRGAPCSLALKRVVLGTVAQPGDINVIGYTKEEADRLDDLEKNFPLENFHCPLIERGLSHDDCLAIIDRAGIELPLLYRMGYKNANCIGCPKGGQNYWQAIRADFPERFAQIQAIQESIGPGSYFLRFRSGSRENERMSLAELPPGRGNMAQEPSFSCSFFCELVEQELAQEANG